MSRRTIATARTNRWRRAAVGVAASVVLASLLCAASALGVTNVGVFYDETESNYVGVHGGDGDHDLVIGFDPAQSDYLIRDNQRFVASHVGPAHCSVIDARSASCPRADDGLRAEVAVDVSTWHGDDRIRIDPTVEDRVEINGSDGDDVIDGGPAGDQIIGGDGADLLRSHRGGDLVEGHRGGDVYHGGRGADDVYARDHHRDRVIDCGRGSHDEAWIDKRVDPRPIGCETVHRWD